MSNFSYTAQGGLTVSQACPQTPADGAAIPPVPGGVSAQSVYTVAPNMGILTGPPAAMAADIQNCVSWQNWAGADYLTNVHVIGADAQGRIEFPTPYVVVVMVEDSLETRIETGPFTRGTLVIWFEDVVPAGIADETSAYNWFCNNVEAVITELNGQTIGGRLLRRGITPLQRPMREQVDGPVDFYNVSFNVKFGPE